MALWYQTPGRILGKLDAPARILTCDDCPCDDDPPPECDDSVFYNSSDPITSIFLDVQGFQNGLCADCPSLNGLYELTGAVVGDPQPQPDFCGRLENGSYCNICWEYSADADDATALPAPCTTEPGINWTACLIKLFDPQGPQRVRLTILGRYYPRGCFPDDDDSIDVELLYYDLEIGPGPIGKSNFPQSQTLLPCFTSPTPEAPHRQCHPWCTNKPNVTAQINAA